MKKHQLWMCNRTHHGKGCIGCDHKYPHYRLHMDSFCSESCGEYGFICEPYKKGDEKKWTKNN